MQLPVREPHNRRYKWEKLACVLPVIRVPMGNRGSRKLLVTRTRRGARLHLVTS